MKISFLLSSSIFILSLGVGCTKHPLPAPLSPTTTSASEDKHSSLEAFRKTPDRLEWQVTKEWQNKIKAELKTGKKIQETPAPRKPAIPSTVYPPQFVKFFALSDTQFALVNQLRGNTLGVWDTSTTFSSGIWYAGKNDTTWKPFITLTHPRNYTHNNIYDFWNEGKELRLLLVDSYGAGSGEGTAKVLEQADTSWKIRQCFYFANGEFHNLQRQLKKKSLHEVIADWLSPSVNDFPYAYQYTFNPSRGTFEATQLDKATNQNVIVVNEECQNVISS